MLLKYSKHGIGSSDTTLSTFQFPRPTRAMFALRRLNHNNSHAEIVIPTSLCACTVQYVFHKIFSMRGMKSTLIMTDFIMTNGEKHFRKNKYELHLPMLYYV